MMNMPVFGAYDVTKMLVKNEWDLKEGLLMAENSLMARLVFTSKISKMSENRNLLYYHSMIIRLRAYSYFCLVAILKSE